MTLKQLLNICVVRQQFLTEKNVYEEKKIALHEKLNRVLK